MTEMRLKYAKCEIWLSKWIRQLPKAESTDKETYPANYPDFRYWSREVILETFESGIEIMYNLSLQANTTSDYKPTGRVFQNNDLIFPGLFESAL